MSEWEGVYFYLGTQMCFNLNRVAVTTKTFPIHPSNNKYSQIKRTQYLEQMQDFKT